MMCRAAKLLIAGFLVGLLGICGCGCSAAQFGARHSPAAEASRAELASCAVVGVVETSGSRPESRLVFFDAQLSEIGAVSIAKAGLGELFYDACVPNNVLYVFSQGYFNLKDGEEVLEISLDDLSTQSYDIGRPGILAVTSNGESIFAWGNLNNISFIARCDTATGSNRVVEFPDEYVSLVVWDSGFLYAFVTAAGIGAPVEGAAASRVVRLDEDLKVVSEYDISPGGVAQYRALLHENVLYFTSEDQSIPDGPCRVNTFDLATGSVGALELSEPFALSMTIYDGKLYVVHHDIVANEAGGKAKLSMCDLVSGFVEVHDLPYGADQMVLRGNTLYFLDARARVVYSCDAESLEVLSEACVSEEGAEYTYLSSLFPMPVRP